MPARVRPCSRLFRAYTAIRSFAGVNVRLVDWMMHLREDLEERFRVELSSFEEERQMPYVTSIERLAEARGEARGETRGQARAVLRQLSKILGSVPEEHQEQVRRLQSERLEQLSQFGYNAVWLADSRRLFLQDHRGKLYIVDTQSGTSREILSVAPHSLSGITVSRDNRQVYFSTVVWESDIWLATLE